MGCHQRVLQTSQKEGRKKEEEEEVDDNKSCQPILVMEGPCSARGLTGNDGLDSTKAMGGSRGSF